MSSEYRSTHYERDREQALVKILAQPGWQPGWIVLLEMLEDATGSNPAGRSFAIYDAGEVTTEKALNAIALELANAATPRPTQISWVMSYSADKKTPVGAPIAIGDIGIPAPPKPASAGDSWGTAAVVGLVTIVAGGLVVFGNPFRR